MKGGERLSRLVQAAAIPAKALGRLVLDALLPPRCLVTNEAVDRPGQLSPAAWRAVDFIAPPLCASCGLPFEVDPGPDAVCGACARKQPAYDRARAVMRYDEGSRSLVLRFKHADRTEATPAFARWMARAGAVQLEACDVIAPVPLHRWRLLRRRYNQAALLAHQLGRLSGKAVVPDLLLRRRNTPSQGRLSRGQRRLNVRGAFAVAPRRSGQVVGASILLIDDVLTTGATLEACARALKRAGAARVEVLTLARAVRPQQG
ncbi:ComF family protein [Algihabitans albus]|uniref:ComF family protein n=1 Tax=Algihabitans albus TaxID=2164067 RepID=UPI001F43B1D1|nr:ComF family protein [Algihabitans albus]